jgi:hypothetical protein
MGAARSTQSPSRLTSTSARMVCTPCSIGTAIGTCSLTTCPIARYRPPSSSSGEYARWTRRCSCSTTRRCWATRSILIAADALGEPARSKIRALSSARPAPGPARIDDVSSGPWTQQHGFNQLVQALRLHGRIDVATAAADHRPRLARRRPSVPGLALQEQPVEISPADEPH